MTTITWSDDELERIGRAGELRVAKCGGGSAVRAITSDLAARTTLRVDPGCVSVMTEQD